MSVVFSGTNQGSFTSTGGNVILPIRSDVDYINVYNITQMAASQTTAVGVQYYWQRGFPPGAMIAYFKSNAAAAANLTQYLTSNGFYLIDTTINVPGPSVAFTSITSATPPVVATGSTAGLSSGNIVRLFNVTGGTQLSGRDFTIDTIVTNTSFDLAYMNAGNVAATTGGQYRVIPYNPYFYPPTRVIANISQATQAIVTLTVNHTFTVGQSIRFVIPTVSTAAYGMTELDGVEATIVAIDQADADGFTNTITVSVDTTGFTAFHWPLTTDPVHSDAQVVPVGQDSGFTLFAGANYIGDSEVNQGLIGISLTGGASHPAGANNDVIYWVAGKSFSGGA